MVQKQNKRLDKMEREQKLWQTMMESHLRHITHSLHPPEYNATVTPPLLQPAPTITNANNEDMVMDTTNQLLTQQND